MVDRDAAFRSYEVYQRERVGQTTNLIKPRQLISDGYLTDPYPLLAILRESYPCYRDWVGNRFWVTRYDDVTSVLVDDANYETRSKRWFYGLPDHDRELDELDVTSRIDDGLDRAIERTLAGLADEPDLASGFAARLPLELWGEVLDLADDRDGLARFARLRWLMGRGAGWDPVDRCDGLAAFEEASRWLGAGVAAAVLEADNETLHGGLANLWFLLLTNPDQLDVVRRDPRLMTFAWLETLRHSTPVLSGLRFARHEVERFGRLLPAGALVQCSAAAANRDPRVFTEPDRFLVERRDLCQREPRGQYRADGLPSGIAVGLGPPSRHPAVPRDRPRSAYALTRDVAVRASQALLARYPDLRLADGAEPTLRSLRLGEMHTCWSLPVTLGQPSSAE